MQTILVSGGAGVIGKHLCPELKKRGYDVTVLSRKNRGNNQFRTFWWDPDSSEIEEGAIESADYIIHLSGANLGDKRWTSEQKQIIIDSRVKTAHLIFEKIQEKKHPLKAFISSSAIGYYGTTPTERKFNESDPPGNDFLAEVCLKWEEAVDRFQQSGIRTVKIRSGVVLTREGGALSQMKRPVVLGIGSPFGTGRQYMPWIHIDDLCAIYTKAVEDSQMSGVYNAATPDNKTNAEFMRLLAHVLNQPFWFPKVPAFVMKLILGERASIILQGNKVSCEKIIREGFNFKYPDLESALKILIR